MADDKLTVFATGNGDSILIEAHGFRVLTDINWKLDAEEDLPDLGEEVWRACPDSRLDVFLLTHPDKDHVRGFEDLFHVGEPEGHDSKARILAEQIWCSPYAVAPNYITDEARPLLQEIQRRLGLVGTPTGSQAGNILRVMAVGAGEVAGRLGPSVRWELLAPTSDEADIPQAPEGASPISSNPSSLVIRWSIEVDGRANLVMLGGDSTAAVWERVWHDNHASSPGRLAWNILVSPHHSSRYTFGGKNAEGDFEPWPDALSALDNPMGRAWVVSSSDPILDDGVDPPSPDAEEAYVEMLGGDDSRFLCTGDLRDGDPGNAVFYFTSGGPARSRRGSRSGAAATTAVAGGGSYG